MKIKISEATNVQLDWMVAKCEGAVFVVEGEHAGLLHWPSPRFGAEPRWSRLAPNYSTNWAQGGPIIERERISIRQWTNVPIVHAYMPQDDAPWASDGTSPLIAALRCFVASKLGAEVEVPDELA